MVMCVWFGLLFSFFRSFVLSFVCAFSLELCRTSAHSDSFTFYVCVQMVWLAAGSASYDTLRDGLMHGRCPSTRANGRRPRHLYMLPGGVAEIFTSTPGQDIMLCRTGIIRLSLETQAQLVPCYVFGGTDFFHNFATADNCWARLSRKMRMGVTLFWGRAFCPLLPFTPKVTMCVGEPIPCPPTAGGSATATDGVHTDANQAQVARVKQLFAQYQERMMTLFETHKTLAGYPTDRHLRIVAQDFKEAESKSSGSRSSTAAGRIDHPKRQ